MTDLTAREREVLRLAADGLSNEEIADRLGISRRTVEAHMHTVFRKTGVTRRADLVAATGAPPAVADRLDAHDELVRQLLDRHLSLFAERAEITVTVGGPDGRDSVVERRWTTPKPYVVYRMLRPIVSDGAAGVDPAALRLTCDVFGTDVQARVVPVLQSDGLPLAVVLFQPGLSTETGWALRYDSDGLLDPLRDTGSDGLYWRTATLGEGHRPTVTEFTLRVAFPPGWTGLGLVERSGAGRCELTGEPAGQQVLTWRDDDPIAARYDWDVTGSAPA